MTVRGRIPRFARLAASICVVLNTLPVAAQTDDRIRQLETRLDELVRQAEEIRRELNDLKGTPSEPSSLADVQPIESAAPAPVAASKVLNPDISVVGTFLGHAGDTNEFDERPPLGFDEVEVAYEAFVDPYARGRFFIALGPDEIDLEEGYAQFIALPYGLTAKAGKTKATFGKANLFHNHTRPWIDQPLMLQRFFGDEGLADVGLSVSKAIDAGANVFLEVTGEVYSGDVEGVFGRQTNNDLFYNAHLKAFRDLSESANIEAGVSFATGTLPDDDRHNRIAGVDVTYRWRPLQRPYGSFVARFEGLANQRPDSDDNLFGFYASADYQLARRWFAGVRLDRADRVLEFGPSDRFSDRGVSATLTFRPSEFSQIRGQFRRSDYEGEDAFNEFLIQLQFAIGAHGAHTF